MSLYEQRRRAFGRIVSAAADEAITLMFKQPEPVRMYFLPSTDNDWGKLTAVVEGQEAPRSYLPAGALSRAYTKDQIRHAVGHMAESLPLYPSSEPPFVLAVTTNRLRHALGKAKGRMTLKPILDTHGHWTLRSFGTSGADALSLPAKAISVPEYLEVPTDYPMVLDEYRWTPAPDALAGVRGEVPLIFVDGKVSISAEPSKGKAVAASQPQGRESWPHDWANWAEREKSRGFIQWAEPAPASPSESRYAIVRDNGLIKWSDESPNPEATRRLSGGAFYGDTLEQAVQAAIAGAMAAKAKTRAVLAEFDEPSRKSTKPKSKPASTPKSPRGQRIDIGDVVIETTLHEPFVGPKSAPTPASPKSSTKSASRRDLQAFAGSMPPMQGGKARKALLRPWKLGDRGLRPLHDHVETFLEEGWTFGSLDEGAYFRSPSGIAFHGLPQVAFKYAQFVLPDYERERAARLRGIDSTFESYIEKVAADPKRVKNDDVYAILSQSTSPEELSRLGRYLNENFPSLAVHEDMETVEGEKGWARLRIDDPQAPWRMASAELETSEWLRRQENDRYALSNPRGFFANQAAYKALKESGAGAAGLQLWDILPNAGFIEGDEGRLYTVLGDGNIVLNADTASPEKRATARTIMLVA